MIRPVLRFNTDELLSALDAVDPVDLLIGELAGRNGAAVDPHQRLTPWSGGTSDELVLLEDPHMGRGGVLPAAVLRGLRAAALAALAGRIFVPPGVVTAAVLGSGIAAQLTLTLVARNLPGLSHVAVCPFDDESGPLEPRVVDQLDLTGVGWSVTSAAADAVFGANLVIATGATPWSEITKLPRSAALVNATGADLPDRLLGAVDQVYVDDASLVGLAPRRWLAGPAHVTRPVEADFAQVLSGAHAGRTHVDHVLLVDLLGADALDTGLACLLHRAAVEQGLGERLIE